MLRNEKILIQFTGGIKRAESVITRTVLTRCSPRRLYVAAYGHGVLIITADDGKRVYSQCVLRKNGVSR